MMGYLFLGIRTSVGCTESSSASGFQLKQQPHPDGGATKRQLLLMMMNKMMKVLVVSSLVSADEVVDEDADLEARQVHPGAHPRPAPEPQEAVGLERLLLGIGWKSQHTNQPWLLSAASVYLPA